MSLVSRDRDGKFTVGPLSEDQYMVLVDSLELASAWTSREINAVVAKTLRKLLFNPDVPDAPPVLKLPLPGSDKIDTPDD